MSWRACDGGVRRRVRRVVFLSRALLRLPAKGDPTMAHCTPTPCCLNDAYVQLANSMSHVIYEDGAKETRSLPIPLNLYQHHFEIINLSLVSHPVPH